ncbi:hypothetical protein FisN_11Lh283 [Fistulifera solaris]|uniref:SUN domain-containing protein n=1 Tax=Fistulifera solaris TaxID=1519565 RepID=A0A1Z5K0K6_FISSO|nr:hypothetical protein FisN_11Lh283 [Fistulifera solaris]|eukprot:GAX19843.1 hypothetical protein FisN_11Lh283 [Fistulifera solaris]
MTLDLMRSRVRGRRIAWLLASALPLVAQDDVRKNSPIIVDEPWKEQLDLPITSSRRRAHRKRNGTAQLRKLWSSPLAIDDRDSSWRNTYGLQDDFFGDRKASEFLFHATIFEKDTCPRTFVYNKTEWCYITEDTIDRRQDPQILEKDATLLRNDTFVQNQTQPPEIDPPTPQPVEEEATLFRVDYASKSAGALVLESSDHFQGTSNLLTNDQDAYAIVPCEEPNKSVVIGLSEDILVKQVVLANYERYSSHVKTFRVQGSMTMGNWRDLGTFTASRKGPTNGKQTFELQKPAWARYLKFQFLTHYGNEYYCTVSQISVHGSTMLQGFHEQWEETNQEAVETLDVKAADALDVPETSDLDPITICVTPLSNAPCPVALDFEGVAASSSNAPSVIPDASIRLLSRVKVRTSRPPRYSLWQRRRLLPEQPTCTAAVIPPTEMMKRGEWSLVERSDAPCVTNIRKLLASMGVESEKRVQNIVVKLTDTNDETKPMIPDKIISERTLNERQAVKPVVHETRKEGLEEAVQGTEPHEKYGVKHEVADAVLSTEIVPEKADYFVETGLAFAKALERLPSSRCLLDLDFPNFKTKFVNSKIAGSASNGNAQVNSPMEPIFKKLTDEIKALQASVSIHDMYAKESIICYQRVVMELMVEMESIRRDQEARILQLEQHARRRSPFVFLGELWGWVFHLGHILLCWVIDGLRSMGTLVFPLSVFSVPWTLSWQPYLTELSCQMLRYISLAYDSITACLMLPGTNTQLSLPHFCKL